LNQLQGTASRPERTYEVKELVGLHFRGDLSGHWTSEQLEIIRKQSLKEK
jgi:hypothetical protein